jgi:hypothetical protein
MSGTCDAQSGNPSVFAPTVSLLICGIKAVAIVPIESEWPGSFGRGWAAEFTHRRHWTHLLEYLQSLPWPRPETVQVLIHDEEDDCFGLWMMYDGKLVEVALPRTERYVAQDPWTGEDSTEISYLHRTDLDRSLTEG